MLFASTLLSPCRSRTWYWLAAGLAATAPTLAAPPSVSPFEYLLGYTTFDGVDLQTVILKSREFTLSTDTLASWVPLEAPVGATGFSLRSPRDARVTVSLSVLGAEWAADKPETWAQLVALLHAHEGGETTIVSGETDSDLGAPAIRLFGWHTREVVFTAPAVGEEPARLHHYVYSTDGKHALLVVLQADTTSITAHHDNFWFFLSRLAMQ